MRILRIRHKRRRSILAALAVAGVLASAAFAFTATNTVPASTAGSGSGAISGYTVSAIAYTLNGTTPTNLDAVMFTIAPTTARRLWIRVPRAGSVVEWLKTPLHTAVLIGLAALLAFAPRRRRVRTRIPDLARLRGPAGAALASAWESRVNATTPSQRDDEQRGETGSRAVGTIESAPWKPRGTFSYSAAAPRGPVYPRARVATGDTVFLGLVDNLDLRFDYRFESPVADEVAGAAALEAARESR